MTHKERVMCFHEVNYKRLYEELYREVAMMLVKNQQGGEFRHLGLRSTYTTDPHLKDWDHLRRRFDDITGGDV